MKKNLFIAIATQLVWLSMASPSWSQSAVTALATSSGSPLVSPAAVDPSQAQSYGPITVPEIAHGILAGYLKHDALPNSLALVPPPPVPGSPVYVLDEAVSEANLKLSGSQRWDLAAMDADLSFPHAAGTYSCSLGISIDESVSPHLYLLLRRSLTDAGLSTYAAKNRYVRRRPFAENKQATCTPQDEAALMKDGSYPSGHTAIGWAWALILTEVAPDHADAILARGRAYGDSRLVCNVHWQSDVSEGRVMGAATVARLHADPGFRTDLDAAKTEYAVAIAKGLKPIRNCTAEATVLATDPSATNNVVH